MELLKAVSSSVGVYYNYTGDVSCFNAGFDEKIEVKEDDDGEVSWGYFTCTDDMFWENTFNLTEYMDNCHRYYGTWPQPNWQAVNWGGWGIGMGGVTNIVLNLIFQHV